MINFAHFNSLIAIIEFFTTEHICKKFLAEQRWGNTVVCPYCGCTHCYTCANDRFKCSGCKNTFSAKVGTIFEDSNISLKKWYMAMYLISSHKKGISSCQLARDIKVTQKTAWYMEQKIRTLYGQSDEVALEGEVELDEMYLGGKEKWKHANKKTEGTQGRSTKTKQPIIKQFVKDNASLFTDELNSYNALDKAGYNHEIVMHKANEYVNGNASTNCVEGFWSHFRRCIFGIYHHVSVKHLQRYIDEMVFRWNTRKSTEGIRFQQMFSASYKVVNYNAVKDNCISDDVIMTS